MPTREPSPPKPELADALFTDQSAFETWLESNHESSPGIWCMFAKKDSGQTSVTYKEAVEVALCFGWIDGQARTSDVEGFFRVRFVQRRPRSMWSKINRDKVLALVESGRMRPSGLAQIEIAKANGQWDRAYDGPATAAVPPDLEAALQKNAKARVLQDTRSNQPLLGVVARTDGGVTGDSGQTHRDTRRQAGTTRDVPCAERSGEEESGTEGPWTEEDKPTRRLKVSPPASWTPPLAQSAPSRLRRAPENESPSPRRSGSRACAHPTAG